MEAEQGYLFTNRCKSLPVVNSTCSLLNVYYNRVKEANCLTKFTIGLAETTLKTSIGLANPVLEKFNGPIRVLDEMASRQLEKLETAFPILHQETDVVVSQGKAILNKTAEPALKQLNNIEGSYENIKNYGMAKVSSIKEAKEQLKTKVILKKLLDASEYLVEKYLVEDRIYVIDDKVLMDYYKTGSSTPLTESNEQTEQDISNRVKGLTCTVYSAIQRRCLRRVNSVMHSFDNFLDRISRLVDLLDKQKVYLKTKFNEKMVNGVKKVHLYKEYMELVAKEMSTNDGRSLADVSTNEERAKILLKRSISNLLTALSLMNQKLNFTEINTRLREKYTKIVERAVRVYKFIQPSNIMSQKSYQNYQTIIQPIQQSTHQLLKIASQYPALVWLIPNVEVVGIVQFEEDNGKKLKDAESIELLESIETGSPTSNKVHTSSTESNMNYEDTSNNEISSITTGTSTVEENITNSENSDENESFDN